MSDRRQRHINALKFWLGLFALLFIVAVLGDRRARRLLESEQDE